jgi:hypothetical protein
VKHSAENVVNILHTDISPEFSYISSLRVTVPLLIARTFW